MNDFAPLNDLYLNPTNINFYVVNRRKYDVWFDNIVSGNRTIFLQHSLRDIDDTSKMIETMDHERFISYFESGRMPYNLHDLTVYELPNYKMKVNEIHGLITQYIRKNAKKIDLLLFGDVNELFKFFTNHICVLTTQRGLTIGPQDWAVRNYLQEAFILSLIHSTKYNQDIEIALFSISINDEKLVIPNTIRYKVNDIKYIE